MVKWFALATRPRRHECRTVWLALAGATLAASLARSAAAHPEGFSGLAISLEPGQVRAIVTLHSRDLNLWFPPRAYPNYVTDICRALEKQGPAILDVRLDDVPIPPSRVKADSPETGLLRVELLYPSPSLLSTLAVESKHLSRMPRGHQQIVLVDDRREQSRGATTGRTLLQDTLDAETRVIVLDVPPMSGAPPATQPIHRPATNPLEGHSAVARAHDPKHRKGFFLLGVEHILTGYDHLLFVAALLLACKTLREAATIITFFTVAHSITLTLAALDLVRLRGAIVEPAIAATILCVAVENLVHRPRLGWRCAITFFFGLIHGLGFAGDLRAMLPGSTFDQVVGPLLKFSAGVEAGHLSLVIAVLPLLLWMKQRRPRLDHLLSPLLSGIISAVGAYWLVVRVFSRA